MVEIEVTRKQFVLLVEVLANKTKYGTDKDIAMFQELLNAVLEEKENPG